MQTRSIQRRLLILSVTAGLMLGPLSAARASGCERVGASPFDRPALTADGGTVVFTTNAALVPEDGNGTLDVYAQTAGAGTVELVSVTAGGRAANARSGAPSVSADGRFVAFQSDSTDLVAGDDSGGVTDIFVRDRSTGITEIISTAPDGTPGSGASSAPAITSDGGLVAFQSVAADLVAGDTNALSDVFVHDRDTGATVRASVWPGKPEVDGLGSFGPSISDTGKVAFHSTASSWVPSGSDLRTFLRDGVYYVRNVFVHDLVTGTTEHVSLTDDGEPPDGLSLFPDISADGRSVAFLSSSTNLVPGDTNNRPDLKGFSQSDVFVRDLEAGTTTRASVAGDEEEANGVGSSGPAISADGGRVAFESDATNLATADSNGTLDVFVRDRTEGTTVRASTTHADGDPGSAGTLSFGSVSAALSGDGGAVAFVGSAPGLLGSATGPATTPHLFGVFVRSLDDGAILGPLGIGCRRAETTAASVHAASRSEGVSDPGRPAVRVGDAPQRFDPVAAARAHGLGIAWLGVFAGALLLCGTVARRRPRTVMTAGLVALSLVPATVHAHHHSPVQPGAAVIPDTEFGTASMNFVFRDRSSAELYVGTAAHAVRELWVGSRIANDALGDYGTIVYSREGVFSFSTQDFALIKVDPDDYASVDPAVRHWGGPTGVARVDELLPGLPTYQYGQGSFFRTSEPTRAKTGSVGRVTPDRWGYIGWVAEARGGFGGDSGSPILVGPGGEALAVTILFASAAFGEPGVQMGPSIELILQELRLAGFDLELVTAPFHGPAGDAVGLVEHCAAMPIEDDALNQGCLRPGSDL